MWTKFDLHQISYYLQVLVRFDLLITHEVHADLDYI